MASFPADPRRFNWSSPDGRSNGRFVPRGRFTYHGTRPNAIGWQDEDPIWSARMFVGLSVGHDVAWELDDVVNIVRRVRDEQTGTPDASFIMQRGLYTQVIQDVKQVVDEPSVQVIILNLNHFGVTHREFEKQMVELAEVLAQELNQKEVIIQVQENGIPKKTIGVEP